MVDASGIANKAYTEGLELAEIDELRELLERASDAYYNSNELILTDQDFDVLKAVYEGYADLCEGVPHLEVGAPPREGRGTVNVSHSYEHLVGTLAKVNSIRELEEWLASVVKWGPELFQDDMGLERVPIVLSQKYDGNSVVIEFSGGRAVRCLTRGRGGKGVDLTHVFGGRTIASKEDVGVKFEVVMTYEDFETVAEQKGQSYANPRSMVSGLLGDLGAADFSEYFTLVPLSVSFKGKEVTRSEEIAFLRRVFPDAIDTFQEIKGDVQSVVAQVREAYERLSTERFGLPYMIDGLVVELGDPLARGALGYSGNQPNFAVALKFPYMEKESRVTGIEFDYGNTGRITPMVCFEPVSFNGAVQKRVSLANYRRFNELKLGVGSRVIVQYRNDVLSYVTKVACPENDEIEPIPFIERCPICGEQLYTNDNETFVFCDNPSCRGRVIGKIEHFLKKLDVKGIKEGTIEKLVEAGLVKSISDLYFLDYGKVAALPGLGEKSAEIIRKALEARSQVYDYEVLGSVGIEDVGLTLSKALCLWKPLTEILKEFRDAYTGMPEDQVAFRASVKGVEGFSDIMVGKLYSGLEENFDLIEELFGLLSVKSVKEEVETNRKGKSFSFCITGAISGWAAREDLVRQLELRGHRVVGGVSRKTDYLITDDPGSGTEKNKKADQLGVPKITGQQLREMLGL